MKKAFIIIVVVLFSGPFVLLKAQELTMLGLGDSIGEGVQSADAGYRTQPSSYLTIVASHLGTSFPLPWIRTSPQGVVGDTSRRSRFFPYTTAANIAVSGATVRSILRDSADAYTPSEINSETDLVLFPQIGSQVEVVESVNPFLVICWIGNNDALSAALSFDQLDASQLTPVDDFEADFAELVRRLTEATEVTVFATIPDVTSIGFLVDRFDLIRFLGSDYGLAPGEYTSIAAMFLIKLGLADEQLLQDPNFVLDTQEIQKIQGRIQEFNQIIFDTVSKRGMPVVDTYTLFNDIAHHPVFFGDTSVTSRFLGGLFSLDGVHPSDTGHAIIAAAMIQTINEHFTTAFPTVSPEEFRRIFLSDPFIDKDGDGKVTGRFGAGLLETLAPLLGISGDKNDFVPNGVADPFNAKSANRFLEEYLVLKGRDFRHASEMTREEIIEAFKDIFGINRP